MGGASFTYDSRGNLSSDGAHSFGYDIYNRLITGPNSAALAYDPAGRLYETSGSGATTTRFLYDGANIITEYDTSGAVLRRYVHGLSGPMVWYEGAGTSSHRWLIPDERGSIIARDNAGAVSIYSYDEYGTPNTWSGPSTAPRFRYAGAIMLPQAQLYSMRARVYSPGIGRFLQTDPILTEGGINLYAYAGNDPVNAVDPLGLTDKEACPPKCKEPPVTVVGTLPNSFDFSVGECSNGRCYSGLYSPLITPLSRQADIFGEEAGAVEGVKVVAPRPAHPAPAPARPPPPPPPLPWWILRPTGLGAAIWVLTPTDTAIDDCRALPGGCVRASDGEPLRAPYMTVVNPNRLRAHDECSAMCRDIFVNDPNSLPGVGRNYQQRMGRCVRQCMENQGFTPF